MNGAGGTIGGYRQALERIAGPNHSSAIHVQLPSYRDCELKNTILALRGMAANPERVHIAVCCQGDDPETLAWLDTVPDLAYRYYTEEDAPGTCRARYDCSRMLGDEDYVLHLDSHMRFARHWDLMLLDQLARCGDEKAILTGYYGEGITPFLRAVHRRNTGGEPTPGALVSGHFLFAPARLDREVPFDPCMYFVGDELPMALRYFTHGWNVYHPGVCCVRHLYDRAKVLKQHGLPFAWPDSTEPRRLLKLWIEKQRILKLYRLGDNDQDLAGFDLGNVRTLEEFEEFAGICFRTKTLAPRALNGDYDERSTAAT